MNHLELFSGTHSFGKVSKKCGNNIISLDRDLDGKCPFSEYDNSDYHIQEDILTWDYKIFPPNYFDLITASPVCLWWSRLRAAWIGRKLKAHGDKIITREILQEDIDTYGKPMVDKVFEIIEYFKPKYWIVENPQSGKMKKYITEKYPQYDTYNDFSYCKYSDWGYEKKTRMWNNIPNLESNLCKKDCENIIKTKKKPRHKKVLANGYETINGEKVLCNTKELRDKFREYKKHKTDCSKDIGRGTNRLERYRIPEKLIYELISNL